MDHMAAEYNDEVEKKGRLLNHAELLEILNRHCNNNREPFKKRHDAVIQHSYHKVQPGYQWSEDYKKSVRNKWNKPHIIKQVLGFTKMNLRSYRKDWEERKLWRRCKSGKYVYHLNNIRQWLLNEDK